MAVYFLTNQPNYIVNLALFSSKGEGKPAKALHEQTCKGRPTRKPWQCAPRQTASIKLSWPLLKSSVLSPLSEQYIKYVIIDRLY